MSTIRDTNQAAFRQLKPTIDQDYPYGRFVAIDGGQMVADAASFAELQTLLNAAGRYSSDVLVVQAGHDYPDYVDIFI